MNSSKVPENNLVVKTDWRRPVSPSNSSGVTDYANSISSARSDSRQAVKQERRPVLAGQSVAALQQHHQWLMRQQDANAASKHRSVSPAPTTSRSARFMGGNNADGDVILDEADDDHEGDDVEEERMVIIQDMRARSPSINTGSNVSTMSAQPAPNFDYTSQNSKIVKEGWLYRKNGLMQWKAVYVVAKQGNAVKPGALYLYKDAKCENHIQTYDMSEVLEVSPRAQDYRQGIKWEIRMLVKKDDVSLATDDMRSRKDWVDSLTSIMGKVSLATQNELTSRIHSSEQMNRDLQSVVEELDVENQNLRKQIDTLKSSVAEKERLCQQEFANRENELKEIIAENERLFEKELQDRHEMDRKRQALETKCEMLETKCEMVKREAIQWRTRVDDLEHQQHQQHQQKQTEYRNIPRNTRNNDSSFENNDALKETMSDVKFNLQVLRDQIKNSSEGPLLDIKSNVNRLCDSLEDAKMGWNDLQNDIIKFLETNKDDANIKDSNQKHLMELLRNDFIDLRQELVGVSTADDDGDEEQDDTKLPSLSEKFDILIQMVENVQISQSRLSSSMMDNNSTSSSDTGMPSTPPLSHAGKDSELYKAVTSQQKQLTEWIQESREMQNSSSTTDIGRLHEKITETIGNAMSEIAENQKEGQDEQEKNIKIIGNYLKLISTDIENSAIPDLSGLSQQLEDVVVRLNSTEERLSILNGTSSFVSANRHEDAISYRNMPPPSPSSRAMSDDDKLSQLHSFVKNTEQFMERSLRILSNYAGGSNGMEEIVRRAVKAASKAHSQELSVIQDQNKKEREVIEKKMERYEGNARDYFDKSIDKMHTDLHEFTGVMYGMLERLVLQALEHSSTTSSSEVNDDQDHSQQQQKSIQNVVELYGKLSGLNQVLKAEITRLSEEKEELESAVKSMKKTSKDLERQIEKQTQQLKTVKSEYERVQHARKEDTNDMLMKELEPLMQQIATLRKLAAVNEEFSENMSSNHERKSVRSKSPLPNSRYSTEEIVEDKLRFPPMNTRNRRSSFTSQYSDSSSSDKKPYNQESVRSPLIGTRDKPREKTPLANYLEHNSKK